MRFDFLGQVVIGGDHPPASARGHQPALTVARLVLERPSPLSREELADLLWPADRPPRWEGPARQVVSRARALLQAAGAPPDCVVSRGGTVELQLDEEIEVDVECAHDQVAAAERALRDRDWACAEELSMRAVELLRLPFFPASDAAWTSRWRDRLRSQRLRALHTGAEAAIGAHAPERAVARAEEALGADPLDEVATRALMAAYEALGSRGEALTEYERCRRALHDELGVRPSEETEAAYLSLLGSVPRSSVRVGYPERSPAQSESLPFVGRHFERARLDVEWQAVREGDTRAVVVAGEPGIGKTRLATEVARAGERDDALVLWGTCVAEVGLPYQPFGAVLEQLLTKRPATIDKIGTRAKDLASLVPGIVEPRDVAPQSDHQTRTRLFRAVQAAIAAVTEPMLIVFDDLHVADGDTLALLRHLTPILAQQPCLLVIAVRDTDGGVAATLAEIHRRLSTTTFGLPGLTVDDLVEMLEQAAIKLDDDVHSVATELAARTSGNPFYISQLVLDARATRRPFDAGAVPDAIAQLVARRLDALEPDFTSTLAIAAVAGEDFELSTLEACSSIDADRLLDIVESLSRQGFLTEVVPERFTFLHALVRDAVLATIGPTRRQRLHRRLADALAAQGADASVLARHYFGAGAGATREATRSLLDAGKAALAQAAWAAARGHLATAAELATDVDDRCEALVGLGRAERALGNAAEGRATIETALALALARSHQRGPAAARATLALVGGGGRGVAVDLVDAERAALLRDALAGLERESGENGADDVELLVAVMGELALSLVLTDAKEERDALAERCLREARRSNNANGIAVALQARRVALMGPAGTEARVADGRETLALPAHAVAPERVLAAHLGLVEDLLELGDRAGVDNAIGNARALAEQLAHPYWSWATTSWRALIAIIDGELEEAEALAFEALAQQAPAEHPEAMAALGVNLVDIRLFQGRSGEMLDLLRDAADQNPNIPTYRAVLALCCTHAGERAAAREAYEQLAAHDFALPPDSNWLLAIVVLADTAATLGDHDGARTLKELLEPYGDRHAVLNCFGGGGAYWGPVSYHLARLEALLGRPGRARQLLVHAIEASERLHAPTFAAISRRTLAALGDR